MLGEGSFNNPKRAKKISKKAIIAFFVTLTLCYSLIGVTILNKSNFERVVMEELIMEKSIKISDVISKMLYKTQALSTLVIQNNGKIENFEKVAEALIDDPAILNVIIAPGGIVSNVYPLRGNEPVLGFDLFKDGETTRASTLAKERGHLILGGPFNIVQGGQALIGRLPIWVNNEIGRSFWGFVNVTLKYPEALNGAGLPDIESKGLSYEIWRINPETNQKQIIARSSNGYNETTRSIEKRIQILNADWYFRVAPLNYWYEYPETWMLAFIGLCISFLVAFVMQKNFELEFVKSELETKMTEITIMAEELRQASKAKTSFLANMSHEIRTPMNGIIGILELVLDKELNQETKDYLNKIKTSANGLLEIIDDILDISKIETGKMDLEVIPFSIHEVFKACEMITSLQVMEKNIDLYSYTDPSIVRKFLGDPTKLRQILLNLLSNAIKFTEAGRVSFMASVQEFDKEKATVYFEVKDSGIGMSPEQLKKVFEPFSQADVSTTRKYGGTGLGLTIVKSMIELMDGELKVESQLNAGSKFSFVLTFEMVDEPAYNYDNEEKQATEIMRPTFEGNVLVCEDNELNQQVIKEHLAKVGLDVVIAENGKLGVDMAIIQMINGQPFDLILMDIHMPVMDGLEAAKKLKKLGIKTPIIAMTANVMSKDREFYQEYGMTVCLGKPFTAQKLWECLLIYLTPIELTNIPGSSKSIQSVGHSSIINTLSNVEQAENDEGQPKN